jgi:cytochrome c oxidase subunit 2
VVTLTALLVYGLGLAREIVAAPDDTPVEIAVIGEQFWWRVRYPEVAPRPNGAGGRPGFESANEIHVPVGRTVRLTLTAPDVIHSFWVPQLAGKLDLIPGSVNRLTIRAERAGVFRGQCAEFCGQSHALMAFRVVAHEPADYADWLEAQRRDAEEPRIPFMRQGRDLFLASGCGGCHTVRGTSATGTLGPDLTHLGTRAMIAAESFPLNQGTLAGWIADSQHLKPGNRMPSFPVFTGEELRALAAWLESLE